MLNGKIPMIRTRIWFIVPIIILATTGMFAVPTGSFWFTFFAAILGFGLGLIPINVVFQQVLEEIGSQVKQVMTPYYDFCTLTRREADKQGYDIPWALRTCQKHLVLIGFAHGTLHRKFRDELVEVIKRGVHVEVYMLSPSSPAVAMRDLEFKEINEHLASLDVTHSVRSYKQLCDRKELQNIRGSLTVWGYTTIPFFQALAIDIDKPKNMQQSDNLQLVVTHTLFNLHADKSPTFMLNQSSMLTKKYVESIQLFRSRTDHELICAVPSN